MANKVLKTRVSLLYKTFEQWEAIKSTFVPMNGEICFTNPSADDTKTVLFKVGNGIDVYQNLSYGSATASDVYAWAKKASLDWNDLDDNFKKALGDFIDKHYEHANTLYRIIKDDNVNVWQMQKSEDGGEHWVDTETIDITAALEAFKKDLAKIASTGNVNDLIQDDGDVLILNCNL